MALTKLPGFTLDSNSSFTFANANVTANVTAGNIKTDNLLHANGAAWTFGGNPGGSNTYVQFNDASSFGGSAQFTFDKTSNTLNVSNITTGGGSGGNITGADYISANYLTGTLTTAAQPNITSVGTLTTVAVSGNVSSGGNIIGNGQYLTSIAGGNVSGQVGNALVAGTVYTAAQPNITSVGSLASLTVTGLVTATAGGIKVGNLQDTTGTNTIQLTNSNVIVTGNITAGAGGTGNVSATYFIGNGSTLTNIAGGNVTGQVGNSLVSGTVYTNAQPNITSVGTLSSLSVTANVTAGNLIGVYANGTSNISIPTASGNVLVSVAGNANIAAFTGVGLSVGVGILTRPGNVNPNAAIYAVSNIAPAPPIVMQNRFSNGYTTIDAVSSGNIYMGAFGAANPTATAVPALANSTFVYSTTDSYGLGLYAANGNVSISAANTPNILVVTGTGANISGTITITGNATVGNLIGVYANGTSNINIPTASGNVSVSVAGNANIATFNSTGLSVGLNAQAVRPASANASSPLYVVSNIISAAPTIYIQNKFANGYTSIDVLNNSNLFMGAFGAANPSASTVPALANMMYIYSAADASGIGLYSSNGNVSFSAAGNANIAVVTGTGVNVAGTLNATGNLVVANASLGSFANANSFIANISNANIIYANTSIYLGPTAIAGSPSALQVKAKTGQDPISISHADANSYNNINLWNNSNVQVGSMGAANPSATYYANMGFFWSANGLALSGNGYSATGGTKNLLITNAGIVTVPTGVAATNTTTGALVVTGGVGVSGNIYAGNLSGTNITGTLTTQAQPNITSVGTLASLSVTANITGGNITSSGALAAADLSASGNAIISGNLTVGGTTSYVNVTTLAVKDPIIELGGGTNNAPLTTNDGKDRGSLLHYYTTTPVDAFMGWDNSNAEFAFGSNVSMSGEVATFNTFGNVRASTFIGALSGAATTAATVTTNAQPNITSLGTLASLSVTANITSGNINGGNAVVANYFVGDGSLLTGLPASYSNTNVAAYLPTYSGNLSATNVTFTGSNVSLGSVSNLHITGGSANYVLTTDGAGSLSWAAQSGGGSSTSTTISVDNFTGNGVADTYTLSVTPTSVNSVFVNYNGAFVGRGSYSLDGANLTFGSVPANGASIEVTTIEGLTIGSGSFTTRTATGDGSTTDYTVTSGATVSSVLATLDGVLQTPTTDYTISGSTLTFTTAPYNGAAIQIRELAVASSSGGGGASNTSIRAQAMTMGIIFGG